VQYAKGKAMKIDRTSVVDQILEYIKNNISTGVWSPGEKIEPELKMVQKLNVSRASIHNAIQQLVAIGILESFQGKGTFVKSIPVTEIQERLDSITKSSTMRKMIEFRIILESEVCRHIAGHLSENTIRELYACVANMKHNFDNPTKFAKHDFHFHRILMQETRNEVICRSIDIICSEIQRQNILLATDESKNAATRYHMEVVDHLSTGDGAGAAKAMIRHLQATPCHPPFATQSLDTNLFNLT